MTILDHEESLRVFKQGEMMRKHPRKVYELFGPVLETSLPMVSL